MNTSVWIVVPDSDNYDRLELVYPDRDIDYYRQFVGIPLADTWVPLAVRFDRAAFRSDFPSLPGGDPLIANARALNVLDSMFHDAIEALPLNCVDCTDESLYMINVLQILDCFDRSRSEFEQFSDGRIYYVDHYVFKEDCVADVGIFKIPELLTTVTYATSSFRQVVEEYRLKGLKFRPVP